MSASKFERRRSSGSSPDSISSHPRSSGSHHNSIPPQPAFRDSESEHLELPEKLETAAKVEFASPTAPTISLPFDQPTQHQYPEPAPSAAPPDYQESVSWPYQPLPQNVPQTWQDAYRPGDRGHDPVVPAVPNPDAFDPTAVIDIREYPEDVLIYYDSNAGPQRKRPGRRGSLMCKKCRKDKRGKKAPCLTPPDDPYGACIPCRRNGLELECSGRELPAKTAQIVHADLHRRRYMALTQWMPAPATAMFESAYKEHEESLLSAQVSDMGFGNPQTDPQTEEVQNYSYPVPEALQVPVVPVQSCKLRCNCPCNTKNSFASIESGTSSDFDINSGLVTSRTSLVDVSHPGLYSLQSPLVTNAFQPEILGPTPTSPSGMGYRSIGDSITLADSLPEMRFSSTDPMLFECDCPDDSLDTITTETNMGLLLRAHYPLAKASIIQHAVNTVMQEVERQTPPLDLNLPTAEFDPEVYERPALVELPTMSNGAINYDPDQYFAHSNTRWHGTESSAQTAIRVMRNAYPATSDTRSEASLGESTDDWTRPI